MTLVIVIIFASSTDGRVGTLGTARAKVLIRRALRHRVPCHTVSPVRQRCPLCIDITILQFTALGKFSVRMTLIPHHPHTDGKARNTRKVGAARFTQNEVHKKALSLSALSLLGFASVCFFFTTSPPCYSCYKAVKTSGE